MRRIIVSVGVLLALLVAAVLLLPQFLPTDLYRKQIETAASQALGRDVKLKGQVQLSLIPRLEVRAGETTIANPKEFGDAPFASMKELRVAVKLWPLLSQKVEVDEFVLVEPSIDLINLPDGRNNWTFPLGSGSPQPAPKANSGVDVKGGALGDVNIVDGKVVYDDRVAKKIETLSQFQLKAAMKAIDQPFDLKASGLLNDLPFEFTGHIGNPKALLNKETTAVDVALQTHPVGAGNKASADKGASAAADLLDVAFKGDVRFAEASSYSGHLTIQAPDLRSIAAIAGAKLPAGKVYRSFSLAGDASGSASEVGLKNAVVAFDDITGKGDATLKFAGKPKLTGSLSTNLIDATPYASAAGAPAEGAKKTGGWGNDPIDLSPLKLADVELDLKAAGIKYQKFDFGPTALLVLLKDGKLAADLKQTSVFGGAGTASVMADASSATPQVGLKANLTNLAVKPLLVAAAGFTSADGAGNLQIDVKGGGATLQALMSSLAGAGKFELANGVLNGVDLTALVKAAKTALSTKSIPVNAFGANAQTKFSSLNGSFTMKDGIATTNDMKLNADQITVTGQGALDVGGQKVAFTLSPLFNNSSEGVGGFGLPIKFSGSWSGIGVSFDFDALVQRAAGSLKTQAASAIQNQLSKQLGLPGSTSNSGAPAAKPKDALKNALGGLLKGN